MDTTKNEIEIVDKNGAMNKEFLTNTIFLNLIYTSFITLLILEKVGLIKKLTTEEKNEFIKEAHIKAEKMAEEIILKQKSD